MKCDLCDNANITGAVYRGIVGGVEKQKFCCERCKQDLHDAVCAFQVISRMFRGPRSDDKTFLLLREAARTLGFPFDAVTIEFKTHRFFQIFPTDE